LLESDEKNTTGSPMSTLAQICMQAHY